MAQKPRVQAPKQRSASDSGSSGSKRGLVAAIVGVAAALVLGGVLYLALGQASGGTDPQLVRSDLETAGCTLQVAKALSGEHSIQNPGGTSPLWNTDPPTSGPHYAIAAIFNIYDQQIELARLVHDLEHGGVYILYGKDVPKTTVDQLRAFYDGHKTGTVMAPLDRLGDQFALGAWVTQDGPARGYLAKCKAFDEKAVAAFFSAFQFKGPEHFDPSDLRPGH